MGAAKNILIGGVIVAVVGSGIVYVNRLNKMSNELVVVPNVKVHKLALDGLTLRVDAVLKNPTRTKVNIKFPFVKILFKDSVIGSSQAVDRNIEIPKHGEARIEGMMVNIPFLGMFSLSGDLLKSITDGSAVKMSLKTISTIDLGFKRVPYEDLQEFTIKKQQTT